MLSQGFWLTQDRQPVIRIFGSVHQHRLKHGFETHRLDKSPAGLAFLLLRRKLWNQKSCCVGCKLVWFVRVQVGFVGGKEGDAVVCWRAGLSSWACVQPPSAPAPCASSLGHWHQVRLTGLVGFFWCADKSWGHLVLWKNKTFHQRVGQPSCQQQPFEWNRGQGFSINLWILLLCFTTPFVT